MVSPTTQSELLVKSLDSPDDRIELDRARADIVTFGTATISRSSIDPGFRWSEDLKPLVGTESCQESHIQYVVSGRGTIRMDDGTEVGIEPGDVMVVPPGHDAWVDGDEPIVGIEYTATGTVIDELVLKTFDDPDQTITFDHGRVDVVHLGPITVSRGTVEPGWKWSEDIASRVGTDSCPAYHTVYVLDGKVATRMDDGTEKVAGPGDAMVIPPGHDGWTLGDEPCVYIDFTGVKRQVGIEE